MTTRMQRTGRNAVMNVASYLVPAVVTFASTPYLIQKLGVDAYGLQGLALVLIGYFAVLDAGLDVAIIRYAAEDQARGDEASRNRLLNSTLFLYLAVGMLGAVLLLLGAEWLARVVFMIPAHLFEQAVVVFRLTGLGLIGTFVTYWGRAMGLGLQRTELTSLGIVVTSVVGVLAGMGAVALGYGVVGFVFGRMMAILSCTVAFPWIAHRLMPSFRLRVAIERDVVVRVSGYLGYGFLNRLLGAVASRMDQTLVAIWLGVGESGVYALAYLVVSSFGYLMKFAVNFVMPMASELHSLGELDNLRAVVVRTSRVVAALTCMISTPMLLFGPSFLTLWVGAEIAARATPVFLVLTAVGAVNTMAVSVLHNLNAGIGRMGSFTGYGAISALVLTVMCTLLVRPFGIMGAALGMLSTNLVDLVYMLTTLRRGLSMPLVRGLREMYFRPILVGALIAVPGYLVREWSTTWIGLLLVSAAFCAAYIGVSWIVGVFGESEKRMIRALAPRRWVQRRRGERQVNDDGK